MEVKLHPDHTIDAFNSGDASAFAEVYDLYYHQLRYFAFKMINSEEDASDIVSQVFLRLWERHANFKSLTNIKAFLFIATRNDCLLFHRYGRSEKKKENVYSSFNQEQAADLLNQMAKAELFNEIYKELESLPGKQKSVLKLFYLEGATMLEIAKRMEVEVGAVKMMKYRALRQLRERLKRKNLLSLVLLILMHEF